MKRAFCTACFVMTILFLTVIPLHATLLKRLNLDDLCVQAATIFRGVCINVDNDDPVTIRYIFNVKHLFKGIPADTVSVRMHKTACKLARVPTYMPGQEVVLFLYPESPSGFTSPVGFGQGSFFILPTDNGSCTIVNEYNNIHLFSGLRSETFRALREEERSTVEVVASRGGPLAYDVFAQLIQLIIARRQQ